MLNTNNYYAVKIKEIFFILDFQRFKILNAY
jgi:hypothetical protein